MSVADALHAVRARIAEAALRAGRAPESVTLVAVSKTFPPEVIQEAIDAGQRDFGENRVEEALPKMAALSHAGVCWHMVGHVQSRKARDVAGRFTLVHSVDSVRLARKLNDHTPPEQRQAILLECNVSGEASKAGFRLKDWAREPEMFEAFANDVAQILALPRLRVLGLMTMAPIVETPEQARPFFADLRALRDALRDRFPDQPPETFSQLSMGMTDDFEAAIAEGATLVRIGRAIFGARQ